MGEPGVTRHDIALLRDIVGLTGRGTAARQDTSATDLTFELLDLLEQLLDTDWTSFHLMEAPPGGPFRRVYQQATEHGEHLLCLAGDIADFDLTVRTDVFEQHWWQLPHSLADRAGEPAVTSVRSHFSAREWADHPVHAEYLGCVDQIVLAYPVSAGRSLRVVTTRETGRPYGLRELTLMQLLLPHLRPLLEAALHEHADDDPGHRPQQGGVTVTLRQREILHLVTLGMPNRQVGRLLGISEGTVRKHLENAYHRMGVRSRTEAIFRLRADESETAG